MNWNRTIGALVVGATLLTALPVLAQEIPTIRFGRQTAAEENLWLMMAKPELAPNLGKAYKLEWSQFRASDATFKAYEGGQIDMGTVSANAALVAASKGLEMKIVASLSQESSRGAQTYYVVKNDGPKTIAELKGKNFGINGYRSSIEMWGRAGLKSAGLNPDRDVNWAVVPFPAMVEAVKAGKIDIGGVPEIFAAGALARGEVRSLFTSKTGVPFDEELILLITSEAFIKKQPAAMKAFMSDLVTVNKYYLANLRASRQALLDAKLIGLPPEALFALKDYVRDPNVKPSIEALEKMQDMSISLGFQEKKIDVKSIVDTSLLPAS